MTKADGTNLDATDFTSVTNNFFLSLFSYCNITLNGVIITPAADLYNYYSFYKTTLMKVIWYLDDGDLLPCDPKAAVAKHSGVFKRWNRI